jgi:hypothetical protein
MDEHAMKWWATAIEAAMCALIAAYVGTFAVAMLLLADDWSVALVGGLLLAFAALMARAFTDRLALLDGGES